MSVQLDRYLAERALGSTMHTAASRSGIGIDEARLTENALARREITLPEPETAMATIRKHEEKKIMADKESDAGGVTEVQQPDFAKAVRIFRQDIKPAVEAAGERSQEASTGYKAIKKDCRVNTRAAKFVFKLAGESEEKRNDVLRSVRGLLEAMNIGITDDLVSDAEGEDNKAPIVPTATGETHELTTLQ